MLTEISVIGSILISPECLPEVRKYVVPADFATYQLRCVYEAACALADDNAVVDPLTIFEYANRDRLVISEEDMKGLMDSTPTAANVIEYAKLVAKHARLRAMSSVLQQARESTENEHTDPVALLGEIQEQLADITEVSTGECVTASDASLEYVDYVNALMEGITGSVKTGFTTIDSVLGGGLIAEGLYIIAARPGIGKTAFGLTLGCMLAKQHNVLFVSLEMSRTQLTARCVANYSGLHASRLIHGPISAAEGQTIMKALDLLSSRKLYFSQAASVTVPDVERMARQINAEVIIIDYLGLIQPTVPTASQYEKTTAISGALKRMARTLKIPVVCLAQLNRESTSRQDKRPAVSDLRDSGAIEQDADVVMLLHRPQAYSNDDIAPWDSQPFEVNIAKNRHAGVGTVTLQWYASNGRFIDSQTKGQNTNSWQ